MSSEMVVGRARAQRPAAPEGANTGGVVVVYSSRPRSPRSHESVTQSALARKLAALKGYEFAGPFESGFDYGCRLYFVPGETVSSLDEARRLGMHGEHDMFGGVVPFPFVATKTITHPLPAAQSRSPVGWSSAFAQSVHDVVLPGFSAFTPEDVREAGRRLLKDGAVRLKKAGSSGGCGQAVIADTDQLDAYARSANIEELLRDGIVVEQNLTNVVTLSVGQVRLGKLVATYYGTQQLTRNNEGDEVYGGSRLVVIRGGFDALLRCELAPEVHVAIEQACTYHSAAMSCFSGMFASRCNYDIAQGLDEEGRWRSGVLEQSWRIGGASGAEIAALEAFQADPGLDAVCASTTEVYGENPSLPAGAVICFQGVDEEVGPLTKYAELESYAKP